VAGHCFTTFPLVHCCNHVICSDWFTTMCSNYNLSSHCCTTMGLCFSVVNNVILSATLHNSTFSYELPPPRKNVTYMDGLLRCPLLTVQCEKQLKTVSALCTVICILD
jgi:hypothetical protein